MKIKFAIPDLSDIFGHDSEHQFAEELKRQSETFEGDPDWVYAWYLSSAPKARTKFTASVSRIPKDRKYRVFGRIGDTQHDPDGMVEWLNDIESDLLFFAYSDRHYHGVKAKTIWLPWSYDPSTYYPSNEEPIYDVTFLGTVSVDYPLRQAINERLSLLAERYGWRVLQKTWVTGNFPSRGLNKFWRRLVVEQALIAHIRRILIRLFSRIFSFRPGLGKISLLEKDSRYIVGEKYAKVLRSTKVSIFGTSIFKHPIKRLFFGLGSGTCVLMNTPNCADRLGLKDGENYVAIDEHNWAEKLKWILDHEDERQRIAQNGLRLVQERHTHQVRAKELLNFLEEA